jgi:hypothetical protein
VGIRCADHVTPFYPQNLALTSPTGGCRSVGIVRSRTKATECILRQYFDCHILDGFISYILRRPLLFSTASCTLITSNLDSLSFLLVFLFRPVN